MPELKETLARPWLIHFEDANLRPEVFTDETAARKRYADLLLNWSCHLFCAAEEVEKPRADKERPLKAARSCVAFRGAQRDDDEEVVRLRSVVDDIDAARSPQTHGRVPESTAEAKQEASPARKEKSE